jgi:hypothetical protein
MCVLMVDYFKCENPKCEVIETEFDFDFAASEKDGRTLCQRCREKLNELVEARKEGETT